jgi:hypothetical protein
MAFISRKISGIETSTSHAPCVNLVRTTIASTTVVSDPPTVLMICDRRIRRRTCRSRSMPSSRFQCRTIPH